MTTIQELEARLMPLLEEMGHNLWEQLPSTSVCVYSRPSYRGRGFFIDCVVGGLPPKDVDNVALTIDTSDWKTTPRINADICWGHPSRHLEAEVFEEPQPLTEESVQFVLEQLPRLYAALYKALERRAPPD